MGTFDGLTVALSGLTAHRALLDTAGQNVANAGTEGYTRQRVKLSSLGAPTVPGIWTGRATNGGVSVDGVERLRDAFLEVQGQQAHGLLQDLTAGKAVLDRVESLFPEPSTDGLGEQLSAFWSAFHDVANQPGDLGTRSALLARAGSVADWLNQTATSLSALSSTTTAQASTLVDETNRISAEVARLNESIARGGDLGLPTNELQDQRDQLTMRLAELVGGVATVDGNGVARVMVGGTPIVEGTRARSLQLTGSGTTLALAWSDGSAVQATGGELRGMVAAVSSGIPSWEARLDSVASALAAQVNGLHATGFDLNGAAGGAFFTGTTAATLRVAVTDPRAVAASSVPPGPGGPSLDAGIATALAAVGASPSGPDALYSSLVTDLGLQVESVGRRVSTQSTVTTGVDAARESQSGVSIDEEMASILTYQRGYEASSRVLTAVDQMLDTLINRTGLVGRG